TALTSLWNSCILENCSEMTFSFSVFGFTSPLRTIG
ncbi:hypothetical protein XELAEV_180429853mg, partial [Xenopus laevis]